MIRTHPKAHVKDSNDFNDKDTQRSYELIDPGDFQQMTVLC